MYHRQLVQHVAKKLEEGVKRDKIEKELTSDGWSKADIQEAFYYYDNPEKLKHFSFRRAMHSEISAPIAILLIVLSAIASSVIFFLLSSSFSSYTITLPEAPPGKGEKFTFGEQPALSNPDFFGKVKQQFIDEKKDFINADLSQMKLSVYEKGVLTIEVPIVTKGREGSWWETPAGLYKVDSKEESHFSSIGHVYMPWSLNFQGNFFIHGRTFYKDGTLTSNAFTGGCIRLSTEDAKKVYDAVKVGTPVLVFEKNFSSDDFVYEDKTVDITSQNFLVADLRSNRVFISRDSTGEVPIASITKLMTALIATEYINLDNEVTVPKSAIVSTSKPRLQAGEEHSVYELLFPLLMESSNEAAETIASSYGKSAFVRHMNDKAKAIGMSNTHFSDVTGSDSQNTSTAEDLFMLSKYIYNNRSFIFKITSGKLYNSAYGESGFTNLSNLNVFTDNKFFFGGKNGKSTAAKESNLSVFEFPVQDTVRPIVIIVLESEDEKTDSTKLLDYSLANFF